MSVDLTTSVKTIARGEEGAGIEVGLLGVMGCEAEVGVRDALCWREEDDDSCFGAGVADCVLVPGDTELFIDSEMPLCEAAC